VSESPKIIIAIDGYSSCGKSTLAKALARNLTYVFIDSGSMYRAVTWYLLNNNISPAEVQALQPEQLKELLDEIHISFSVNPETGLSEVYLNGQNVENLIRTLQVSDQVSAISAVPEIRRRMVALQKRYGRDKGIVMDGRDIGTTVFPEAELKLFMTANKQVRARRRFEELTAKGYTVTMDEVYRNIEERDHADTHRKESPLRQATDAIVLDNSDLNEQQQLEFALDQLRKIQVV
jgi:CMP/dCMP kinase